ncbi:MAG: type II secretion system protein [Candidatus Omnitrophota bacterium]|nr:type II secretion system protein [Candidatus Omnitrophota bacterium]
MFKRKGFTLIELVMIIVILGILAVVAIPRYFNLQAQANTAAEAGVVGGVRGGIHTFFANNPPNWPAALDAAPAGVVCGPGANACFVNILAQGGVTDGSWSKGATVDDYIGPTTTAYVYNPATGDFN